jgi:Ca2+-binding EF-hand superfamily protein
MAHAAVEDAMFATLDASGDGTVSRAEVVKAVRHSAVLAAMLGVPHDVSERDGARSVYALNAAFDAADTDHDGKLTRAELGAFLAARRAEAA